jgi:MFS family permease
MSGVPAEMTRSRKYRRKLLILLAVATFFEGYDGFVLGFVLPDILADLGGSETQGGVIKAITQVGAVAAFVLAAQADRIGRRRLLLITVIGYTIATAATAASPNLEFLTGAQFVAQIFLGAEWAVAVTIVVEDFPSGERGRGLGIVTAMNTLGGIFVGLLAAVVGLFAISFWSWRSYYLVGIIPLLAVAWARRGLYETERFGAVSTSEESKMLNFKSIWEAWKPQYRFNVMAVGLMHFFRYTAVSSAVFWWPFFAQSEVGMSEARTGIYLVVSGITGAAGFIIGGRLMDSWGRVPTFHLYMAGSVVFGLWLFQTHDPIVMLPVLCLAIFFGLGAGAMTSAFATECFPTYVRSRAAAWCRNGFEIPGGIAGPALVGYLGDHVTGAVGSIGDAMSLLFLAMILPVIYIAWRYIPETGGSDLAAMDAGVIRP